MTFIRIQPAPRIDNISDDGHAFTQLPYPYLVNEAGEVQAQEFWQGTVSRVIGFQKDLAKQTIDLWWRDAFQNPESIVGMYLVTSDNRGNWAVHDTAMQSALPFAEGE